MNIALGLYVVFAAIFLGLALGEESTRDDWGWWRAFLCLLAAVFWLLVVLWTILTIIFESTTWRLFRRWHRIVSEVAPAKNGAVWYFRGISFRKVGIGFVKVSFRKEVEA